MKALYAAILLSLSGYAYADLTVESAEYFVSRSAAEGLATSESDQYPCLYHGFAATPNCAISGAEYPSESYGVARYHGPEGSLYFNCGANSKYVKYYCASPNGGCPDGLVEGDNGKCVEFVAPPEACAPNASLDGYTFNVGDRKVTVTIGEVGSAEYIDPVQACESYGVLSAGQ